MRALIVDDDPVNRKILNALVSKEGYEPVLAEDGQQAVALFESAQPDIVLMDIMMPVMNGYDAARRIKELAGDRFVPIIFLTAVTEDEALSKCVESGGDDFLTKPYNRVILKAKISAMERIRSVYATLNEQKRELEVYRANIQHELEFAEHIFQNITSRGVFDVPYLKSWTSSMSMSMFNGDLLLMARKPSGGLHVLLCDFTGHGLPAAVGALPVSEIFVAMTDRGFSIDDIVVETNRKLRSELPTGFFCAAAFVDVDATQGTVRIWNGGLPELYLVSQERGLIARVPSGNLPLGISERVVRGGSTSVTEISRGMQVFMCTDGLIETVNPDGEMFGKARIAELLEAAARDGRNGIDDVRRAVETFRADAEQQDDISIVQLDCDAAQRDMPSETASSGPQRTIPAEWRISFDLPVGILRDINPVPMILNVLASVRLPSEHRKRIFTILTELYTNALDHGLLGLRSEMKQNPDGFGAYYMEREKRLAGLISGKATFELEQRRAADGYELRLRVSDTGGGFNGEAVATESLLGGPLKPSGRGIKLVKSLCRALEYSDGGRTAECVYSLRDRQES